MDDLFDKIKKSDAESIYSDMPVGAWRAFEKYSQKRNNPSSFPWIPLMIAGLTILLIGSNIFWWNMLKDRDKNANTQTHLIDTVYITQYIQEKEVAEDSLNIQLPKLVYDKLIQSQDKYSQVLLSINQLEKQIKSLNKSGNNTDYSDAVRNELRSSLVHEEDQKISSYETSIIKDKADIYLSSRATEELNPMQRKTPDKILFVRNEKFFYTPQILLLNHAKRKSLLSRIAPKTFSLYIDGGFISLFDKKFESYSGQMYGLGMNTLISRKIRLGLGFQYSRTKAKIEDFEQFSELPEIEAPENGILHEIYWTDSKIGFASRIDYLFKPIYIFRPFAGLGFNRVKSKMTDLEYEFSTPRGSRNVKYEGQLDPVTSNYLSYTLGSDINLRSNLDAFLAFTYNQNIGGETEDFYFIRPGLFFHF
jgi:hypothetical protein